MTTFTISRTTSPSFAGTVGAIARSAALRAWNVLRALKHRHDATMLAGFDDRMLADIGLTRSDVRDAYSVPFWGGSDRSFEESRRRPSPLPARRPVRAFGAKRHIAIAGAG